MEKHYQINKIAKIRKLMLNMKLRNTKIYSKKGILDLVKYGNTKVYWGDLGQGNMSSHASHFVNKNVSFYFVHF